MIFMGIEKGDHTTPKLWQEARLCWSSSSWFQSYLVVACHVWNLLSSGVLSSWDVSKIWDMVDSNARLWAILSSIDCLQFEFDARWCQISVFINFIRNSPVVSLCILRCLSSRMWMARMGRKYLIFFKFLISFKCNENILSWFWRRVQRYSKPKVIGHSPPEVLGLLELSLDHVDTALL